LNSDGRGIHIASDNPSEAIVGISNFSASENYGRLSLVHSNSRDISYTATGLRNQFNYLMRAADRLGLRVSTDKTKAAVYRLGDHLAGHEKWYLGDVQLDVVSEYEYLASKLSAKLCSNVT